MPIRQITPQSQIDAQIEESLNRKKQAIIYNFSVIGEKVVNEAKQSGSYTDRTGNLRSSIGYIIVADGKIVETGNFQAIRGQGENMQRVMFTTKAGKKVDYWVKGKSGDGKEGQSTGQSYARSLAGKFPKGIVLIVVAGMNYASYVSAKGYNVLDSSELLADKLVPKMLKQLGLK